MSTVIASQMRDALAYAEALGGVTQSLPAQPEWGGGVRLLLPSVIALSPDYKGEKPVAWLIANDLDGYDITTTDPTLKGGEA